MKPYKAVYGDKYGKSSFNIEADTKEELMQKGYDLLMKLKKSTRHKMMLEDEIIKRADDFSYNLNPFEFSPEEWQQIRNDKDVNNRIKNIESMSESDFDGDTLEEFQEIRGLIGLYESISTKYLVNA